MRPAHLESRLELADVGRLARRLLRRAVAAARTEDAPVQRALWEHLGPQAADVPVVRATWPGYDRVNVQVGLDRFLDAGAADLESDHASIRQDRAMNLGDRGRRDGLGID